MIASEVVPSLNVRWPEIPALEGAGPYAVYDLTSRYRTSRASASCELVAFGRCSTRATPGGDGSTVPAHCGRHPGGAGASYAAQPSTAHGRGVDRRPAGLWASHTAAMSSCSVASFIAR